jgi:formamidopyrimidine-DNA glycosylase
MPELPEVETMRRATGGAVGCRVRDVRRPKSSLRAIQITPRIDQLRRRLIGRKITAVRRLGKRVVLELDADRLVIEPRMSGLVLLENPPDEKHLRLVIELAGGAAERILFWDQRGLGVVRLMDQEQFAAELGPGKLGPDALSITAQQLRERLSASRREVKVALMDQRALAGIGNIYASEILHRAGVHPAAECRQLGKKDWTRIHAAMRRILLAAIRHQGSTLRDGAYQVSRESPGGYQRYHRVYGLSGKKCLTCGNAEIIKIVQAQRSTFFCPACQRPQ